MPVVRELINRISFKVNPGDKKNAENAFKGIKGKAGGVISVTNSIGSAVSLALKGIGLLAGAGAKLFTDFEKDTASVLFFSRTNEEAQKLLETVNKLRGSRIISERELRQAAAIFAELTVDVSQIEKVLPILRDISIAQPKLDFPQTARLFAEFVKTGDIESLRQLGAAGKDLVEALRLSNIDIEQSAKGQINRAQLLTQELGKQKQRISELAELQRKTETFAFREVGKESSDFVRDFGEKTAPAMTALLNTARDLMIELNKSESLWKTIDSAVKGIVKTLEGAREFIKDPIKNLPGAAGALGSALAPAIPGGRVIEAGIKALPSSEEAQAGLKSFRSGVSDFEQQGGLLKRAVDQVIEFRGEVKVKGEDLQGFDVNVIQKNLNKEVVGQMKDSFRAISAANGRFVGAGGT